MTMATPRTTSNRLLNDITRDQPAAQRHQMMHCRFSPDPSALVTQKGSRCSVLFNNNFYDNLECSRKGVTSLAWPKPKLKLNFHEDNVSSALQ